MNACLFRAVRFRTVRFRTVRFGTVRFGGAFAAAFALAAVLAGCGGASDAPAPVAPASPPAEAAEAPLDFAAWVASNAACEGDFIADVQEAAFAQRLRDAGVGISDDSSVGEVGVGSGTLTPGTPIRLHGFAVRRIDFDFGSGATFAVLVEATPEQARAAIGAKPLPQTYGEPYREGVPMAAATEDVPLPDIRFVLPGEQPGTQEIGCAAFDG